MDLYEAAQRIFRRHWVLILVFVLIGLAVPLAINKLQGTDYVGTARVDLGVDSRSGTDSTALADGALGLATSPEVLGTAIKQAKVSRDVQDMILNQDVAVTPVGTSGVLDISVTDSDAKAAAGMANALAAEIVQIREQNSYAAMQQLMSQLRQQSAALTQQIASVVDQAKRSVFAIPGLQQQQADLTAQRASVDQQIQSLAQTLATAQHPRVIDNSQKVGVPAQSNLAALVALGGLLGLFVGVAVAATREAMRPTLDRNALARHLGVPLLGRLPRGRKGTTALDPWLASYVGAAADAAEVRAVQLVPVGKHPADVTGLAHALDESVDGVHVTALQLPGRRRGRNAQATQPQAERLDAGIVVVAPEVMKSKYLAGLEQHLLVTRRPLIGVISYRRRLAQIVPAAPGAFESELHTEVPEQRPTGDPRRNLPSSAPTA